MLKWRLPLENTFAVGMARLPLDVAFAVGELRLPLDRKSSHCIYKYRLSTCNYLLSCMLALVILPLILGFGKAVRGKLGSFEGIWPAFGEVLNPTFR